MIVPLREMLVVFSVLLLNVTLCGQRKLVCVWQPIVLCADPHHGSRHSADTVGYRHVSGYQNHNWHKAVDPRKLKVHGQSHVLVNLLLFVVWLLRFDSY